MRLPIWPRMGRATALSHFFKHQAADAFAFGADDDHRAAGVIHRQVILAAHIGCGKPRRPAFFSISRVVTRLTTRATMICSIAPALALTAAGVRPTARRSCTITPCAPAHSAVRINRAQVVGIGDTVQHHQEGMFALGFGQSQHFADAVVLVGGGERKHTLVVGGDGVQPDAVPPPVLARAVPLPWRRSLWLSRSVRPWRPGAFRCRAPLLSASRIGLRPLKRFSLIASSAGACARNTGLFSVVFCSRRCTA